MSMSLLEFLGHLEERYGKDMAANIELAVDGLLFREPMCVVSRYTKLPISALMRLKRDLRTDNDLDYFSF